MFRADGGLLNWTLGLVGFDPVNWANGHWTSKLAISIIVIWRWTGYNALIYLAAMQAVPNDLYEAASLDGASRWQQFLKVTIPRCGRRSCSPLVISTIGSMQLFGEPLLLEGGALGATGGSENQYETLSIYLYNYGWNLGHLGPAAAVALGDARPPAAHRRGQLDRRPIPPYVRGPTGSALMTLTSTTPTTEAKLAPAPEGRAGPPARAASGWAPDSR